MGLVEHLLHENVQPTHAVLHHTNGQAKSVTQQLTTGLPYLQSYSSN